MNVLAEELRDFQRMVHATARSKGFWKRPTTYDTLPRLIALMHSELSEALEADRKGNHDTPTPSSEVRPEVAKELADCIIRILDAAEGLKLPVIEKMMEKAEFNKTRPMMNGGRLY